MTELKDKYAALKEKFKDGDWVVGLGENIGCSQVFTGDSGDFQPFSYLNSTDPEGFRLATDKAEREIVPRFQKASEGVRRAGRQTLNLLGTTGPRVTRPFQEGNVAAQGIIASGLEQQQNAILGLPTDFSAFQPQTLHVPGQINTQQFSLGGPQPAAPVPSPFQGPQPTTPGGPQVPAASNMLRNPRTSGPNPLAGRFL